MLLILHHLPRVHDGVGVERRLDLSHQRDLVRGFLARPRRALWRQLLWLMRVDLERVLEHQIKIRAMADMIMMAWNAI